MDKKRRKKLIKYERLREASKEGKAIKKAIDIESYLDIEKIRAYVKTLAEKYNKLVEEIARIASGEVTKVSMQYAKELIEK